MVLFSLRHGVQDVRVEQHGVHFEAVPVLAIVYHEMTTVSRTWKRYGFFKLFITVEHAAKLCSGSAQVLLRLTHPRPRLKPPLLTSVD
jgi:hypothetical protein